MLLSRFERLEEVIDDEGRYTGEQRAVRSAQVPLLASVSAARGSAENEPFGQSLDYDRTVLVDDPSLEVDEAAVLWVDCGVAEALADGGYFERFGAWCSGVEADGGSFDDWESGDELDGGAFEPPVWCEGPYDYVVERVARTECYTLVAVKRVEVSR